MTQSSAARTAPKLELDVESYLQRLQAEIERMERVADAGEPATLAITLPPAPITVEVSVAEGVRIAEARAHERETARDEQYGYALRVQGGVLGLEEAVLLLQLHAAGRSVLSATSSPTSPSEVECYRLAVRSRADNLPRGGEHTRVRLNDGRVSGLIRATSFIGEHLRPAGETP